MGDLHARHAAIVTAFTAQRSVKSRVLCENTATISK